MVISGPGKATGTFSFHHETLLDAIVMFPWWLPHLTAAALRVAGAGSFCRAESNERSQNILSCHCENKSLCSVRQHIAASHNGPNAFSRIRVKPPECYMKTIFYRKIRKIFAKQPSGIISPKWTIYHCLPKACFNFQSLCHKALINSHLFSEHTKQPTELHLSLAEPASIFDGSTQPVLPENETPRWNTKAACCLHHVPNKTDFIAWKI